MTMSKLPRKINCPFIDSSRSIVCTDCNQQMAHTAPTIIFFIVCRSSSVYRNGIACSSVPAVPVRYLRIYIVAYHKYVVKSGKEEKNARKVSAVGF